MLVKSVSNGEESFSSVNLVGAHTGYIVISGLRGANGVQGFHVLIQSMKLSSLVEKRVETFLLKTMVRYF